MLSLQGVHLHYGLSHVLQGVDLSVGAGEVVGLFGRNGVGKTTVMKAIAGWVQPSAGTVSFHGKPIHRLSPDRICRLGIGLIPEDRRIFPGLTVEENLGLGMLQCPGRPKRESRRKLDEIYAAFPRLAERRGQMGTTLSGGEQQMLAIARVLAGDPKLLLIDEPTEGLAPMVVEEIFATLRRLAAQGIPILLVEQNVHRALEVVHRYYALERGSVILEGVPSDRDALMRAIAV
jgi:branched-chain amino acid transport system ATP-binding protein